MTRLRERKKGQRRRRILNAAFELFFKGGYERTSISEIADKADVGVGTIYNYFKRKPDLLLAIFVQDVEELLSEGQAALHKLAANPVEAVSMLIHVYFKGLVNRFDKNLLRELILARFGQYSYNKETVKLDFKMVNQLTEFLEEVQKRGQLAKEINPVEAAALIHAVFVSTVITYIYDPSFRFETVNDVAQRSVNLIFKGLEPH